MILKLDSDYYFDETVVTYLYDDKDDEVDAWMLQSLDFIRTKPPCHFLPFFVI
jgi:hypothetical protein